MNLVLKRVRIRQKILSTNTGNSHGDQKGPCLRNLFMGRLETKLINLASEFIHTWKRFIDDIFIIWTGTNDDLKVHVKHQPDPPHNLVYT